LVFTWRCIVKETHWVYHTGLVCVVVSLLGLCLLDTTRTLSIVASLVTIPGFVVYTVEEKSNENH
jgi:hypothetical protein